MTFIDWHSNKNSLPAVRDLQEALEAAIHESTATLDVPDHYMYVEGFYDHNVKINKLSHRAIEEFNLPVIRTWFRYGQCVPYDEIRPKKLNPQSLPPTGNNMSTQAFLKDPPSREEMRDFFLDIGIGEILREEEMIPFLRDNYERFAPSEYKELYLKNLDILEIFEDLKYDEELVNNIDQYRDQIHEDGMELVHLLIGNPQFDQEVIEHVEGSLHTIEDAFLSAENQETLSHNQRKTIYTSRDLYHEFVWTLPAFVISSEKAKGPRNIAEEYRKEGKQVIEENKETYPSRLDEYRYQMYEYDLIPRSKHYKAAYGETPKAIAKLGDSALSAVPDE